MRRIFDLHLGGRQRDWSAELLAFTKERQQQAAERTRRAESQRVLGTQPSLALERYAGTYEHEMYGQLVITHDDGRLRVNGGPAFQGGAEHWHYDTFRVAWRDRQLGFTQLTFALDAAGEPQTLTVENLGEFRRARAATQRADGSR